MYAAFDRWHGLLTYLNYRSYSLAIGDIARRSYHSYTLSFELIEHLRGIGACCTTAPREFGVSNLFLDHQIVFENQ